MPQSIPQPGASAGRKTGAVGAGGPDARLEAGPQLVELGVVGVHVERGFRDGIESGPLEEFDQLARAALTVERLLEIADQIGDVLDAHRQTNQIGRHLELRARRRRVRHRTGVLDQ